MPLAAFPKCFLDQLCVTGGMTVDEWIDLAAQCDLDGLEFYWGFTPWEDPEALSRIRARAEAHGLAIPMMCFSPDFTQPGAEARRQEVEKQKQAILAAHRLGGRYCRVLSGQRRPGVSREQGLAWAAACIRDVLPFAEEREIILVLENHYKDGYWHHPEFAQHLDVFTALLEAVGAHPYFGVNFDPSNALIAGDDPIEWLEAVKDRVVTMHASDRYLQGGTLEDLRRIEAHPHTGYAEVLKHGVIGQGLCDYDRIFSILKEAGFSGWISIEDGQDPDRGMEDIAASAHFLRARMQQHGLP